MLAWQLGWPIQLLKRMTTTTEWLKWLKFMKMEPNLFHREDWYSAKLAATLKQVHGIAASIKGELLEFTYPGEAPKRKRLSTLESKRMWASILGDFSTEILQQIEDDHKQRK